MKKMTVALMLETVRRALHHQKMAAAQGLEINFWRDRGVDRWEVRRGSDLLRQVDNTDELSCYLSGYRDGRQSK